MDGATTIESWGSRRTCYSAYLCSGASVVPSSTARTPGGVSPSVFGGAASTGPGGRVTNRASVRAAAVVRITVLGGAGWFSVTPGQRVTTILPAAWFAAT